MNNIRVVRMRTRGISGKVKAYFSIAIGPIEIEDMKLIDGANGLFIAFPNKKYSKPGEGDKYAEIVKLTRDSAGKYTKGSIDLYEKIFKIVVEEFTRREGEVSVEASASDEDELPF